jgi:hypothetical protein
MVDETPEDTGSPADSSARPKRPPPTIDLKATEVSSEPSKASSETQPEPEPVSTAPETETAAPGPESAAPASEPSPSEPPPKSISPWVIAPVSGAVAAALVIGVGWLLGWPAIQPASPAAPQLNVAAINELSARVAGLETRTSKPAAAAIDPAVNARIEGLEKSVNALRSDLAAARTQSEKLADAIGEARATQRDGGAPPPDLSGINGRLDKIESTLRTQSAEIAQQGSKIADVNAAAAKPADDVALRRVVAASLLDVAVRHGEPFAAPLEAAKSLADDPEALRPLEAFAAAGVPNAPLLCRELLEIVPKLSPPAPEAAATTGTGIVDRLQAGAAKLVRIQRTDAAGTDRGSIVARVTAAALHNNVAEARRELMMLAPAERAAAQAWLDRVEARDAALAASRNFADSAMASLAKAGQ